MEITKHTVFLVLKRLELVDLAWVFSLRSGRSTTNTSLFAFVPFSGKSRKNKCLSAEIDSRAGPFTQQFHARVLSIQIQHTSNILRRLRRAMHLA